MNQIYTSSYCFLTFLFIFSLIVLSPRAGVSQNLHPEVLQIKRFYDAIEFKTAIDTGSTLIHQEHRFTATEIAFLHQYMALSYYNLGELDSSRVHFFSMLTLRPNTELDPGEISPKIIEFFDDLKKDFEILSEKPEDPAYAKYIIEKDLRPGAAWRSAIIPGWGQFYKGQKSKGVILGGAFWGSLTATIIVAIKEEEAKQIYVDATNPTDITNAYSTYNNRRKTRQILTIATAALWVLVVGDAALSSYMPSLAFDREESVLVSIQFSL